MMNLAVRVRELVSSNVDALIDKASNPAKMLGLLQTEVEENLIGLHGDLANAQREQARLSAQAGKVAADAEGWTAKAKVAVDHGREDLARAALLARESGRKHAAELEHEVGAAGERVTAIETAIAELEVKRQDIATRIAEAAPAPAPKASAPGTDAKTARRMDRLDAIERRVAYAASPEPAPTDVEAEIAALEQGSALEAELAAMKAPTKGARKKTK